MTITVSRATTDTEIAEVKRIFQAYAEWMPIDFDFQGFDEEMKTFPDKYILLLIARDEEQVIGAVGLIPHKESSCEMKRLFVMPGVQSKGAGRALCEELMREEKALGYREMVLDTLKRLEAANALYKNLGFEEIEPYNYNPEPDVAYMSRAL